MQSTHHHPPPWSDGAPPPDRRAAGAHRRTRQPVAARCWSAVAVVNGGVLATLLGYSHAHAAAAAAGVLELAAVCAVLVTWSEPPAPAAGPLPETPPFGWPIYPQAARTRPMRKVGIR